jgi:hypothetical protein
MAFRPCDPACASPQFLQDPPGYPSKTKEARIARGLNVDFFRKTPEALRRADDLTSAEAAFSVARDY